MKLKNGGENTCYSNSSIQMFLSCGETLFTSTNETCKAGFCENFRKYIAHFKRKDRQIVSSLSLRLVANVNNLNLQDSYIDGSQQDTFGFYLDCIDTSCDLVKDNFRITYTETNFCSRCNNVLNFKRIHKSFYITLSRSINIKEKDFQNLFDPSIHELKCELCEFRFQSKTINYDAKGKFLMIRIANEIGDQRLETKIKNIDLDHPISIPNVNGKFKCVSAIVHYSNGLTGEEKGGHYTCFSRLETNQSDFKWLEISDETSVPKLSLPVDLENVYLLMLAKQTEN